MSDSFRFLDLPNNWHTSPVLLHIELREGLLFLYLIVVYLMTSDDKLLVSSIFGRTWMQTSATRDRHTLDCDGRKWSGLLSCSSNFLKEPWMITNIPDATAGNWSGIGTETAANDLHPEYWPPCSAVTRRRFRSASGLHKSPNRVWLFKRLWNPITGIQNVVNSSTNTGRLETDKKKSFICVSFGNMFRLSSAKCLAKLLFHDFAIHAFVTRGLTTAGKIQREAEKYNKKYNEVR